jgi:hypothetical protein
VNTIASSALLHSARIGVTPVPSPSLVGGSMDRPSMQRAMSAGVPSIQRSLSNGLAIPGLGVPGLQRAMSAGRPALKRSLSAQQYVPPRPCLIERSATYKLVFLFFSKEPTGFTTVSSTCRHRPRD